MKIAISDYQIAANSRVITGTITALDVQNNTATVTLPFGSIADIPIHYWCHHNVDDHGASRVFKAGDSVQVLYTGNTAQPAASNLKVLGLVGEIRRCRNLWNLVADICKADGTKAGQSKGIYGFLDSKAGLDAGPATGNYNYWTDGIRYITWAMNRPSRYARGANSGGNIIYMDGAVLATAPVNIAGACLSGTNIIVIAGNGSVHKKPIKDGSWSQIFTQSDYDSRPVAAINFNAEGSQAITVNDTSAIDGCCYLITYSISGNVVTTTKANHLTGSQAATDWIYTKPFAADYNLNDPVIATIEQRCNRVTTDDGSSSTQVYVSLHTDVWENITASTITDTYTTQLLFLGHAIDLDRSVYKSSTVSKYYLVDEDTNQGSYEFYGYNKRTFKQTLGYIVGLDLRLDLSAIYKKELSETIVKDDTSSRVVTLGTAPPGTIVEGDWSETYNCDAYMTIRRWKEIHGTTDGPEIDSRNTINCTLSAVRDGANPGHATYKYPSSSEIGFDPVSWAQDTLVSFIHAPWDGKYNAYLHFLTDFQAAEKNHSRMVSFRTSYSAAYSYYSSGTLTSLTSLTSQTGPLFARSLRVT